jgi:hypothetical protein
VHDDWVTTFGDTGLLCDGMPLDSANPQSSKMLQRNLWVRIFCLITECLQVFPYPADTHISGIQPTLSIQISSARWRQWRDR